jgi:hypothetical protein
MQGKASTLMSVAYVLHPAPIVFVYDYPHAPV